MIIVCQKCMKRYHVEPVALSDKGRKVRCAACSHVWFQESEPLSPPSLSAPENLSVSSPKPSHMMRNDHSFFKRFWRLLKKIFWLICFILAIGLVFGLFGGKEWVIRQIHQAKTLCETMVFASGKTNNGLEIRQVTSSPVGNIWAGASKDGEKPSHYSFIIKGSIVNTSNHVQGLPPLKIYLRGKCPAPQQGNTCLLQEWIHPLSQSQILPGDVLQFEVSLKHQHPPGSTFSIDF